MNKSFLVLIALLLTFRTFSQTTDIEWGNPMKVSKRSTLSDIVAYDQTGFYAIKTETRTFGIGLLSVTRRIITLEHYNTKMNLDRSSELVLEYEGDKTDYEHIIQLNGQLFLFTSYKDQSDKMNTLMVQSINKNTLTPNKDFKKIGEVSYEGNFKSNAGNFRLRLSRDSSKVLAYYNLPYEKTENEKFGFHVLDQQMNELWKKEITLPYEEGLYEIEDYKIDNKGNVHILGVVYKEKRKAKRKGEPNYNYEILSYYMKDGGFDSYPIKLEGKFLTDMQISIDDNRDIICAGFYSNEGTYSIKGTYFIKVNSKSKLITTSSFKEFDMDFITQNMTERQEEKVEKKAKKGKEVELYQYDLDDIIIREDGGAVLVGEQYYITVVTTPISTGTGGVTYVTTYYYNYNDIIVINVSPKGEIEWAQKIAKSQSTANDGGHFSSYTSAIVKDKMYFIFNDHPKNITDPGDRTFNYTGGKNSMVVLVEVDSNGNVNKSSLFSTKDAEVITRPKVCEQVSGDELVLFGQKRKNHQFAKIVFK
ncbi:hypothetical protein [Marinoscillum sp. MHG1-6]|uniref:hypothetical protein n=1 Tax=Marinoscillum sp. MHG1-6 TaxID=2959627 RepID=UPI002157D02B|nr:hypothetical protein [Marinoscillum sp. MHG1-6]